MIKLKQIIEEVEFKYILNENPINSYTTVGDFSKGSSFTNKSDRSLITNPKSIQKVKDFFKNIYADFDFYFVNTKEARKYLEIGEVDENFIFDKLKIKPEDLFQGRINKNDITVFFTNNKGDERLPMTPWIMAHRFGHVVKNVYSFTQMKKQVDYLFNKILELYNIEKPIVSGFRGQDNYRAMENYNLSRRYLSHALGTFKSSRDKNLRQYFEFTYELFAQYLNTGKIKLNRLQPILNLQYAGFGKYRKNSTKYINDINQMIEDFEINFPYYAEDVIGECIGKIFVM